MTKKRKLPISVSTNFEKDSKKRKTELEPAKKSNHKIAGKKSTKLSICADTKSSDVKISKKTVAKSSARTENVKQCNNEDKNHNAIIRNKKKPSSCMKHKRQERKEPHWKRKSKKRKNNPMKGKDVDVQSSEKDDRKEPVITESEEIKSSAIVLPKSSADVSCNWKKLQKDLKLGSKKKRKREVAKESDNKKNVVATPEAEIWFDDVDEVLIESSRNKPKEAVTPTQDWNESKNPLVKQDSFAGLTKILALDCEMVGVGADGEDSILARVSIVNQYGACVYDKLVRPTEEVTDYRTQYSGIRPGDLQKGDDFKLVQQEVSDIIHKRILVGHALHNDLKVLFLDHPKKMIRDTQKYKPFRRLFQGRNPSLKKLSDQVLGVQVQEGEHNSIQDAQATMRLYTMYRKTWEKELKLKRTVGKLKKADKMRSITTTGASLDSDEDS